MTRLNVETHREKGRRTRARLLDALETELERTPWHLMRVSTVATKAAVAPSTLYQYWPDMEAMFWELWGQRMEDGRVSLRLRRLADFLTDESALLA